MLYRLLDLGIEVILTRDCWERRHEPVWFCVHPLFVDLFVTAVRRLKAREFPAALGSFACAFECLQRVDTRCQRSFEDLFSAINLSAAVILV